MKLDSDESQPSRRPWAYLSVTLILTIVVYCTRGRDAGQEEKSIVSVPDKSSNDDGASDAGEDNTSSSSLSLFDPTSIHSQCFLADGNSAYLADPKTNNRPLLIFKYSRTGSTWLARTGDTVHLSSPEAKMVWTHETEDCGDVYSDDLADWFIEYFTGERDGRIINYEHKQSRAKGRNGIKRKCVTNALSPSQLKDEKHRRKLAPSIATIDWKENPNTGEQTMDLTTAQWERVFEAVPNLAIGVLVRTNSVKRAISSIASEEQRIICGSKKLTGDEDCIKELPSKLNFNVTNLWHHITVNEKKVVAIPSMAAKLSEKHGDGKIFCLTYEAMQHDLASEMEGLGKFVGADLDPTSLELLRKDASERSYKRGSDDLSTYIDNYKEVRESLSEYKCILDQLESKEPKNFPACGVWEDVEGIMGGNGNDSQ